MYNEGSDAKGNVANVVINGENRTQLRANTMGLIATADFFDGHFLRQAMDLDVSFEASVTSVAFLRTGSVMMRMVD